MWSYSATARRAYLAVHTVFLAGRPCAGLSLFHSLVSLYREVGAVLATPASPHSILSLNLQPALSSLQSHGKNSLHFFLFLFYLLSTIYYLLSCGLFSSPSPSMT